MQQQHKESRQLCLGSKKAFNKSVRQTFRLEVVKQVVGFSGGLQEVSDWALWRSWPLPSERRGYKYLKSQEM
jgi:hypothetical protein